MAPDFQRRGRVCTALQRMPENREGDANDGADDTTSLRWCSISAGGD